MFNKRFRLMIASLIVVLSFAAVYFVTNMNNVGIEIIQAAQKIQYVGKDKYEIAQKEHKALLAKKKKLTKQADSTNDQMNEIKNQEIKEQDQQKQEQEQQAAQQSNVTSPSDDSTSNNARGDMNTSQSGQIVGNKNSHIYHVPGQRGYNMNSSNAIYFQNEQEAINAGYRKAKV